MESFKSAIGNRSPKNKPERGRIFLPLFSYQETFMKNENRNCRQRIKFELKSRLQDLRKILQEEEPTESLGEYGLAFDYVASGTFTDQEEGYFRYQISWGGPSDEFRFFTDIKGHCHRIEYWFLDWFDGASIALKNDDKELLREIFEKFFLATASSLEVQ